jgi:hypothetical protein
MNKRIAVIMSGHARLVPWGHKMLEDRFANMESLVDWDVFSYTWTSDSESQPGRPIWEQARSAHTEEILAGVAHRHQADQQPWFEQLRQRFLAQGAIPENHEDEQGFRMPRESFYRFLGQVLGFCRAVDLWRSQLENYDYIVRSRWDMTLDSRVMDHLITNHARLGELPPFFTKAVDIMQGHIEISGDTIYGRRDQWLEYFPSTDAVVDKILQGTRQRWHQLRGQWNASMKMDANLEKYYKSGWWFNSHFIWTTIFLNTSVSLRSMGDSFGISPELANIPLDRFQFGHCQWGADWNRLPPPVNTVPEPMITMTDTLTERKDALRQIQEQRRQRALDLEAQIKSQNLR